MNCKATTNFPPASPATNYRFMRNPSAMQSEAAGPSYAVDLLCYVILNTHPGHALTMPTGATFLRGVICRTVVACFWLVTPLG